MRDVIHGHTTTYPIPLAMGCTFDPKLIDFTSLWLEPGEEKTVTFTVDESKLLMWSSAGEYVSEPGLFSLSVGYADHLQLTKQFRLVK